LPSNRSRPRQGAAPSDQRAADQVQHKPAADISAGIAAEHATVGALILAASSVQDEALAIVQDDDFADPRCRFTMMVVRRMRSEGQPVDALLLLGYVNRYGLLDGGAPRVNLGSWLAEIASTAPFPASAPWYAEVVVEAAARRTAEYAGGRITAAAHGDSLADLLAIVTDELAAVTAAISRVGGGVNV